MSAFDYHSLKEHIGHNIVCVGYGPFGEKDFENVAIECENCGEVLLSYDYDENDCPEGGDVTDDCVDCAYSAEYHFVDGECIRREE